MIEVQPTVIIDTREQQPLPLVRFPVERGTLTTGDYSFVGGEHWFAIERKSIPDLIQSLTSERERFTRELERLRGYRFARLLVIGSEEAIATKQYRGCANPKAMMHSIYSIEAKFVPVVFAPTPEAGAQLVERCIFWTARAAIETARKISPHSLPSRSTKRPIAGAQL